MKLVIKLGGSLLFDENGPIISYIDNLLPVLKKIDSEHEMILAVGGGKFVKNYFSRVRKYLDNEKMEWIGIELMKANALFFSYLLAKQPIFNIEAVSGPCVLSGIKPRRSSDANAAEAAARIGADLLIKATDVDGIYDEDPKTKNAKKYDHLSFEELGKFVSKTSPGKYGVLDPVAIEIIKKFRIKTIVINGKPPKNILQAINGKNIGTIIL